MPNGVLVYLDNETGNWVMSVNRFVKKKIDAEQRAELLQQAKEFLREAQSQGFPVVDPDDDDAISERIPSIGEEVEGLESLNRVLEGGLEEAASILPNLWDWLVGITETPWQPDED
jgi:hypothetical protein